MSSQPPPNPWFNAINYNPTFYNSDSASVGVTLSYVNANFLKITSGSNPISSAATTTFNGQLIATASSMSVISNANNVAMNPVSTGIIYLAGVTGFTTSNYPLITDSLGHISFATGTNSLNLGISGGANGNLNLYGTGGTLTIPANTGTAISVPNGNISAGSLTTTGAIGCGSLTVTNPITGSISGNSGSTTLVNLLNDDSAQYCPMVYAKGATGNQQLYTDATNTPNAFFYYPSSSLLQVARVTANSFENGLFSGSTCTTTGLITSGGSFMNTASTPIYESNSSTQPLIVKSGQGQGILLRVNYSPAVDVSISNTGAVSMPSTLGCGTITTTDVITCSSATLGGIRQNSNVTSPFIIQSGYSTTVGTDFYVNAAGCNYMSVVPTGTGSTAIITMKQPVVITGDITLSKNITLPTSYSAIPSSTQLGFTNISSFSTAVAYTSNNTSNGVNIALGVGMFMAIYTLKFTATTACVITRSVIELNQSVTQPAFSNNVSQIQSYASISVGVGNNQSYQINYMVPQATTNATLYGVHLFTYTGTGTIATAITYIRIA